MRIGVDLGGTKIEAAALSTSGEVLLRHRVPTPRERYGETVAAIAGLVENIETTLGRSGTVGIATPGAVSCATGGLKNANSTYLIGRDLAGDLGLTLGREVRIGNDANCFALSEAVDGAAVGADVVFGAILGTGAGGGIVVGGRPITGANRIAGEWGHNPLPWPRDDERPGNACYCGQNGCLETYVSGTGLARDFAATAGGTEDGAAVVALADAGDERAIPCLDRYEDRLARGLAQVINLLDPDVIVLGGGMSNADRLYRNVPPRLPAYVFSDRIDTVLRPPRHGDSSGVRGAAWLWPVGGEED